MYAQAPGMVAPAASQSVVVYGVSIEDPAVAAKVKRVMTIAVACLSMGVIYNLGQAANGAPAMSALMGIAFVWMVPACGYCGAKKKDKNLLCCFWGCNLCNAITLAVIFAWTCFLLVAMTPLNRDLLVEKNKCCADMIKGDNFGQISHTCKGDHQISYDGKMNDVLMHGQSKCSVPANSLVEDGECGQLHTMYDTQNVIVCCFTKDTCSAQLAVTQRFIGDGGGFIYVACVCLFVQMCLGAHFLPPTLPLAPPLPSSSAEPHPPRLAHHTHVCMLIVGVGSLQRELAASWVVACGRSLSSMVMPQQLYQSCPSSRCETAVCMLASAQGAQAY